MVLVGHGQRWVWPIWSLYYKVDCIDFLHAGTISHKLKDIENFWGEHGQK